MDRVARCLARLSGVWRGVLRGARWMKRTCEGEIGKAQMGEARAP